MNRIIGTFIASAATLSAPASTWEDGVVETPVQIAEGEVLTVSDPHSVEFSGGISMTNAILVVEATGGTYVPYPDSAAYPEDVAASTVFATNMLLSTVTNLSARMTGTTLNSAAFEAVPCFFTNSGTTVTCQFQYRADKSSTIRSVTLSFEQSGHDVTFRAMSKRWYLTDPSVSVGEVFLDSSNNSGNNSRSQIYLSEICAHCSSTASFGDDSVTLSGATASTNGVIEIRGAASSPKSLVVSHKEGLPINGRIEVYPYSSLELTAPDITGNSEIMNGITRGTSIYVHEHGRLLLSRPYQLSAASSRVVVDGGVVAFLPPESASVSSWDSSVYIYDLTLKNGARVIGRDPRVRRQGDGAAWHVRGVSPSWCDTGLVLWAWDASTPGVFTFDVEDVTGNGEVDFTVARPIVQAGNAAYQDCTVRKTGGGTVRIDGVCDYTAHPTRVQAGTWMLGVSGAMHQGMGVCLEGGAFSVAGGTTNSVGALSVPSGGSIIVGEGAKLSFAKSSGEVWGSGGEVDVDADLEVDSLRFGEDASGLAASQVRLLRNFGRRCRLDENGYLRRRIPAGMVIRIQ